MDIGRALDVLNEQLGLQEIEETFDVGPVHYLIGCYKAPTSFYVISCACGWRVDTGKSASNAHALMRAHVAGHEDAARRDA